MAGFLHATTTETPPFTAVCLGIIFPLSLEARSLIAALLDCVFFVVQKDFRVTSKVTDTGLCHIAQDEGLQELVISLQLVAFLLNFFEPVEYLEERFVRVRGISVTGVLWLSGRCSLPNRKVELLLQLYGTCSWIRS